MAKKKKKEYLFMSKKAKGMLDDFFVNPLKGIAKSKKFKRGY